MSTPEIARIDEGADRAEQAAGAALPAERVDGGANALVLAPSCVAARRAGAALFGRPEGRPLRVLGVGVGTRARRVASGYRDRAGEGDRFALVSVGAVGPEQTVAGDAVEHVADVNDLTGVGIRMTTALKQWDDGAVRVCFDSLTPVVQRVAFERAYRFVDVMTSHVAHVGAGHWHLDPRAHDDRTVHRLMSAFDVVVRHEDGEWTVRGP